jgi:hypothetical protein
MSTFLKKAGKPLPGIPVVLALTVLLALAAGCDSGTNGGGFVPVTGIVGVPEVAIKDRGLTLHGTVVPANATNRTIVWSCGDSNVTINGGVLTASAAATAGTPYTITATIADGAGESVPYTLDFSITAYDASGGPASNPFPGMWVADTDGYGLPVYDTNLITLTPTTSTDGTWADEENGISYASGGYIWIANSNFAVWTVSEGHYTDYEGIAIFDSGKATVSNFAGDLSHMNGTMVKLVSPAALEGTWTTDRRANLLGNSVYLKLKVENNGAWILSGNSNTSASGDLNWKQIGKGSSVQTTNPADITITHLNLTGTEGDWTVWADVPPAIKADLGGSGTTRMAVYDSTGKVMGAIFTKQP